MLQLFRKNILFNSLLLLPYVFIVHGGRFFIYYGHSKLEHCWLFDQLSLSLGFSETSYHYISLFIILLEAILINFIVNQNKLNPEGQLFGGIVFIILTGLHPILFEWNAVLIANLFFILAIQSIISIYLKKSPSLQLFNFGFFIGVAFIFYSPFIWMLLLGIPGLMVLRGFSLRDFMQIIVGFGSVAFLFLFYLYINNQFSMYYNNQIVDFFRPYAFAMHSNKRGLISFAVIIFLFLIAFFKFNLMHLKSNIALQKAFDFLFWTSLLSLFSIFFVRIDSVSHLILLVTPLSILLSILVAKIKNQLLAETLHLFFALFALFLQLQNW